MELILIRHGEPLTVETDGEPADPALSERGLWQAGCVSDWLACEPIDCVITSSKLRAKQQWAFASPPFASLSRVVVSADGRAQVLSMNEVGHFDATRRRV